MAVVGHTTEGESFRTDGELFVVTLHVLSTIQAAHQFPVHVGVGDLLPNSDSRGLPQVVRFAKVNLAFNSLTEGQSRPDHLRVGDLDVTLAVVTDYGARLKLLNHQGGVVHSG